MFFLLDLVESAAISGIRFVFTQFARLASIFSEPRSSSPYKFLLELWNDCEWSEMQRVKCVRRGLATDAERRDFISGPEWGWWTSWNINAHWWAYNLNAHEASYHVVHATYRCVNRIEWDMKKVTSRRETMRSYSRNINESSMRDEERARIVVCASFYFVNNTVHISRV